MTATTIIGLFTWVLGLCVGSFLNVVIYRLPAGLSVARPARSFCPLCRASIRWYDNLPVLSWLLLRGRCRACAAPISVQYPLVEALTGLTFALVFQLLFVSGAREGAETPTWPADAPLLVAWLVLAAALIACSGMDLIAYIVDTRVTDAAVLVGLCAFALWPRPGFFGGASESAAGAACASAFLASVIMLWINLRGSPAAEGSPPGADPDALPPPDSRGSTADGFVREGGGGDPDAGHAVEAPLPRRQSFAAGALAAIAVAAVGVLVTGAAGDAEAPLAAVNLPIIAAFLVIFFGIVLASGQPRSADREIHTAIEHEAPAARRVILGEMLWLMPIVAAAVAAWALVAYVGAARDGWQGLTGWRIGPFAPLGGAVFAMHGAMVAAGAGWVVRIVFTLVFGREAFATGDIFILAAAGAAIGWDLALLGFLLCVPMALVGWLLTLTLKRSLMIAFGPWLGIGFVAALWLNRPAALVAGEVGEQLAEIWLQQPRKLALLVVILLVGSVFAVAVARLVRGAVQASDSKV